MYLGGAHMQAWWKCACHHVLVEVPGQPCRNLRPPSTLLRQGLSYCRAVYSGLHGCGLVGEPPVSVLTLHHIRILTQVLGIELTSSAFTVRPFTHWAVSLDQPPHPNVSQFLRLSTDDFDRGSCPGESNTWSITVFFPLNVCGIPSSLCFRVFLQTASLTLVS